MHQAISFAFHLMMKECKKMSRYLEVKILERRLQIIVVKIVTGNKFFRFFIIDSVT